MAVREDQKHDEEEAPLGGMSVRDAGRLGGQRVKAKYGSEFFEKIGRKGGQTTKSKYGPAFFEEIGQKGGRVSKKGPKPEPES